MPTKFVRCNLRSARALLLIFTVAYLACVSGPGKLPVTKGPLPITDSTSNQLIAECLLIPRYTESSGVSTGYGHGSEAMSHSVFLASPFIYRAGETFAPQEGDINGVFAFGVFAGSGFDLDGVAVIAPGYKSQYISSLWDPLNPRYFELEPLAVSDALAELNYVSSLLSRDELRGEERKTWSYAGDGSIDIRFNPNERQLVVAYMQDSRIKLLVDNDGNQD